MNARYPSSLALLLLLCTARGPCSASPAAGFSVKVEAVGPFGGSVRSILISRHEPAAAYLGTADGRILKSADGGATWKTLHPGIGRRHLAVDTLVEHPDQPGRLYAGAWDLRSHGGGLFESRDGGAHWSAARLPGGDVAVRSLAISKSAPHRMVVGTLAGVYVTEDGGAEWREVKPAEGGFRNVESVAIGPQDSNVLLVGTWRLGSRSRDFGRTWAANSRGMMFDSDLFSLVFDETNQKIAYAGACTGVYRSVDGGASWTRLRVLRDTYVIRTQVVRIDPVNPRRVYAGTTEGLYVSDNDGLNWRRLTSGRLTVNALDIDRRDNRKILAGTEEEGVLRSDDGGRTWIPSNTGFSARRVARIVAVPGPDPRTLTGLLSDGDKGGFYSFDAQRNEWIPLPSRDNPGTAILSAVALPGGLGRLFGTPQGVYRERAGAREWQKLAGTIGRLAVYDLVADERSGWIFAGTSQGIYRARPETLDFRRPAGYRLLPRVHSLILSPTSPDVVFAATHMGLLRSSDSGATWDILYSGLPADTPVECLAVDPTDARHIFAGTAAGLYESKDGGDRWHEVPLGSAGGHVPAVVFPLPQRSLVMAANRTLAGVWVSEDGGRQWLRLDVPELRSPVQCLAPDPTRPYSFFLGTESEGIYRLEWGDAGAGRGGLHADRIGSPRRCVAPRPAGS